MTLPFIPAAQLSLVAQGIADGVSVAVCSLPGYWASLATDGDMISFYRFTEAGPEYCACDDFPGWESAFSHCRFESLQHKEWNFPVRFPEP